MIHLHIPKQDYLPPVQANIKQLQIVLQVLQERLSVQENYQQELKVLWQKLTSIKIPKHNLQCQHFEKIPMLITSLISERIHQISLFGKNMKLQIQTIRDIFDKCNNRATQHYNKIKQIENSVRDSYDKLVKLTQKIQIQFKQTNEKLICNQISLLNPSNIKASDPQLSMKIMQDQDELRTKYDKLAKNVKKVIKNSNKQLKEQATAYIQQHQQLSAHFPDFIKKYIIQELSLIRNLQYDIDTFINKSNLFETVPGGNEDMSSVDKRQKISQPIAKKILQTKIPKMFLKQNENLNPLKLSIAQFIKKIVEKKGELKVPQLTANMKQIIQYPIDSIINDEKKFKNIIQQIRTQFEENKSEILSSIQCYRLKNHLRFQSKPNFIHICFVFNQILKISLANRDIYSIRFLLLHATSYYFSMPEDNVDITVYDLIEDSEPALKQSNFWKVYLYFIIRESLRQCSQNLSSKGQLDSEVFRMHCDNAVYSALISNSKLVMNSIHDKYFAKNLLAKSAKSYGLSETKVGQMLKFIQNSFEKSQKNKQKITKQVVMLKKQMQKIFQEQN